MSDWKRGLIMDNGKPVQVPVQNRSEKLTPFEWAMSVAPDREYAEAELKKYRQLQEQGYSPLEAAQILMRCDDEDEE